MSIAAFRSQVDARPQRRKRETVRPIDLPIGFIPALFSDGDPRTATDPATGLNKYLCPPVPTPDLVCLSSCTASPISAEGLDRALDALSVVNLAQSPSQRAERIAVLADQIEKRILQYFGVETLARAFLLPSGTDTLLAAAMLVAAERRGRTMTAILPEAAETGTGVPMAAACRAFNGEYSGRPLTQSLVTTVEIPLRLANGSPRSEDEVNNAFAAATTAARGSVIVYLTHGTKTGLVAPREPPDGADVIVDACQARVHPETVERYVKRGWPVAVTGSKFFGGPAFSGAMLFPRARLSTGGHRLLPPSLCVPAGLGTILRWTAALATIDAFEPSAADVVETLHRRAAYVGQALASNAALVPIAGLQASGPGWADFPSIFSFGVCDPKDRGRLLSATELRPFYEQLARRGVLLGQPVSVGSFGGLRVAIGARDLLTSGDGGLARVFEALGEVLGASHGPTGGRHAVFADGSI